MGMILIDDILKFVGIKKETKPGKTTAITENPWAPKGDKIVAITSGGKTVGYYNITKGQSVIGPPKPTTQTTKVAEIQVSRTKRDGKVVTTKALKGGSTVLNKKEVQNLKAAVKAQGFSGSVVSTRKPRRSRSKRHFTPTIEAVPESPVEKAARTVDTVLSGGKQTYGPFSKVVEWGERTAHNVKEQVSDVGSTVVTVGLPTVIGGAVGGPAGAAVGFAAGTGAVVGSAAGRATFETQGYSSRAPITQAGSLIGGFVGSYGGSQAAATGLKALIPAKVTVGEVTAYNPKAKTSSSVRVVGVKHPLAGKKGWSVFVEGDVRTPKVVFETAPKTVKGGTAVGAEFGKYSVWTTADDVYDLTSMSVTASKGKYTVGVFGGQSEYGVVAGKWVGVETAPSRVAAKIGAKGKSGLLNLDISGVVDLRVVGDVGKSTSGAGGVSSVSGGASKGSLRLLEPVVEKSASLSVGDALTTATSVVGKTASKLQNAVVPAATLGVVGKSRSRSSVRTETTTKSKSVEVLVKPSTVTETMDIVLPKVAAPATVVKEVSETAQKQKHELKWWLHTSTGEKAETKTTTTTKTATATLEDTLSLTDIITETTTKTAAETAEGTVTLPSIAPVGDLGIAVEGGVPPIEVGLGLPFPHIRRGRKGGRNASRKTYKYTPSLTAVMKGITAKKAPKIVTGFEIRPVLSKKARKSKKTKKGKSKKKKKGVFPLI